MHCGSRLWTSKCLILITPPLDKRVVLCPDLHAPPGERTSGALLNELSYRYHKYHSALESPSYNQITALSPSATLPFSSISVQYLASFPGLPRTREKSKRGKALLIPRLFFSACGEGLGTRLCSTVGQFDELEWNFKTTIYTMTNHIQSLWQENLFVASSPPVYTVDLVRVTWLFPWQPRVLSGCCVSLWSHSLISLESYTLSEEVGQGWPLVIKLQGRLMNGSHVRNRGAQIEGSGIFSLAV